MTVQNSERNENDRGQIGTESSTEQRYPCSMCSEEQDEEVSHAASAFYFQSNGKPFRWCKRQHQRRNRENRRRRIKRRIAALPKAKDCKTCEGRFPLSAFKGRDPRIGGVRIYRDCPNCRRAKKRAESERSDHKRPRKRGSLWHAENVLHLAWDDAVPMAKALDAAAEEMYSTAFGSLDRHEKKVATCRASELLTTDPRRFM